ncbi:hypothetical protein CsSME_00046431 [Camellia sinensis var. sinensis]
MALMPQRAGTPSSSQSIAPFRFPSNTSELVAEELGVVVDQICAVCGSVLTPPRLCGLEKNQLATTAMRFVVCVDRGARLGLECSRVEPEILGLLGQGHTCGALENLVPSFHQLSLNPVFIDCPSVTPPPFKPHRSSFKHHVSSIFSSVDCGFGTQYTSKDDLTESPEFKWDEMPHREIYNFSISGDSDNDLFPLPSLHTATKKK